MAVFDKSVKIGRAVADPKTDKSLPPSGLLSWGGIKSTAGLAGTTGNDAKKVTGDEFEMIMGNVITNVTQNRTHTVGANQTSTVVANRTDTTTGSRTSTTIGSTMRTQVGPTNDTFTSPQNVVHASPQNRMEPTAYLHSILNYIVNHTNYNNYGLAYVQAYGFYQSFIGQYTDIKALNLGFTGVNIHTEPIDNASKALENKLAAIRSKVEALEPEVAAMKAHPVAITFKTIIIGINQFI